MEQLRNDVFDLNSAHFSILIAKTVLAFKRPYKHKFCTLHVKPKT